MYQSTQEPLISICVPCYNHEKYIPYFMETLLKQDFKEWELIVTDDCSTDNSYSLLKSYSSDRRIRIYKNDCNRHLCQTMNNSFSLARGKYICIMYTDDAFVDGKLKNEGFIRSMVAAFCVQINPSVSEINDIKTAVSEAVTNCIVHGYKDKEGTITILVNELDRGRRCYNEGRLIKRKVIMRNKGRCDSFGGCNGCNKKKECLCLSSVESNNYNNTITNVNKQIQRYIKHKIKDNVCVKRGDTNNTECNRDCGRLHVSKSFYKNNIRTCSNDKNDNDLQCTEVVALVNNTNKQSLTNLFKLNHNSSNSKTKFKKLQINTNPNYTHFRKYNNNFLTQLLQQHKSTITTETKIHNKNIPTYHSKTNYQSQLQLQPKQPILFPNTPPTPTNTQEAFTEEILIIFLTILLDIETLIEKKKIIQLSPLNDFNIEGIFSLFEHSSTNDENDDNILSTSSFKHGLVKVFGFPVIDKYINLLLAKYDLDEVEGLTFSNFFDMLVPFEKVHRVNIDKRKTVYDISYKTLLNIKDFFLFIIETEQKIERFRNKVQQMEGYEEIIKKIFKNEIDINKKGRINNTQLNKYLKCKIKEFKHKYKH
jgi:glycosyltransferase involved in cell wall biosynthesis